MLIWRKLLLGRRSGLLGSGHSKSEGPEVGMNLTCLSSVRSRNEVGD